LCFDADRNANDHAVEKKLREIIEQVWEEIPPESLYNAAMQKEASELFVVTDRSEQSAACADVACSQL
jgi:hypothetical protein